jgi:hypothetical protein
MHRAWAHSPGHRWCFVCRGEGREGSEGGARGRGDAFEINGAAAPQPLLACARTAGALSPFSRLLRAPGHVAAAAPCACRRWQRTISARSRAAHTHSDRPSAPTVSAHHLAPYTAQALGYLRVAGVRFREGLRRSVRLWARRQPNRCARGIESARSLRAIPDYQRTAIASRERWGASLPTMYHARRGALPGGLSALRATAGAQSIGHLLVATIAAQTAGGAPYRTTRNHALRSMRRATREHGAHTVRVLPSTPITPATRLPWPALLQTRPRAYPAGTLYVNGLLDAEGDIRTTNGGTLTIGARRSGPSCEPGSPPRAVASERPRSMSPARRCTRPLSRNVRSPHLHPSRRALAPISCPRFPPCE